MGPPAEPSRAFPGSRRAESGCRPGLLSPPLPGLPAVRGGQSRAAAALGSTGGAERPRPGGAGTARKPSPCWVSRGGRAGLLRTPAPRVLSAAGEGAGRGCGKAREKRSRDGSRFPPLPAPLPSPAARPAARSRVALSASASWTPLHLSGGRRQDGGSRARRPPGRHRRAGRLPLQGPPLGPRGARSRWHRVALPRAGHRRVPEPRGPRSLAVLGKRGPGPRLPQPSLCSPQLPAAGDPGAGPGPRLPALRGQEDGLFAVPQREEPGQEPRRARPRLLPQELRGRSLDKLYNFADCSGLHLIFALNALRRNPNNSWNSSNALSLLKYSASKKYNISWELGNEPNNYRTLVGRSVNGSQLGKDYTQLRSLLQLIRTYSRAHLYGPNIGRPRKNVVAFLEGFMKVAGGTVDAVTWQHYYIDGRVAKVTDFLKTRLLDTLSDQIRKIQKVVNTYTPGKKIWLEGVGMTSAGGMNNLSDSYAAGFLWLNTLGLLASQGIDVVVRHSFLDHGHNHLVDQNFNPLPVLAIHVAGLQRKPRPGRVIRDKLRIYAHCTSYHNHNYVRGSITLYIINLHRSRKKIKLAGTLRDKIVHQYLLQPYGKDGLHSKSVQLNGQPLAMVDDGTLPELKPRPLRAGRTLVIPPLTMSFYVVKNVNALACRYR
ncbi:inactive heparanase-2 isoform X2 [Motacilla alba alba]|uniref:inactive heparanase-2 isoform X2 n=1 Tax=Motacilla alba alba TaxID=1094192 RepID=UPI0018D575A4|nr:inactive heparanase-2 isoform X2 [Motacilla alba alba]